MYSIVLAAAMTTQMDVPAFGRRGGHGCCGATISYSCGCCGYVPYTPSYGCSGYVPYYPSCGCYGGMPYGGTPVSGTTGGTMGGPTGGSTGGSGSKVTEEKIDAKKEKPGTGGAVVPPPG